MKTVNAVDQALFDGMMFKTLESGKALTTKRVRTVINPLLFCSSSSKKAENEGRNLLSLFNMAIRIVK